MVDIDPRYSALAAALAFIGRGLGCLKECQLPRELGHVLLKSTEPTISARYETKESQDEEVQQQIRTPRDTKEASYPCPDLREKNRGRRRHDEGQHKDPANC